MPHNMQDYYETFASFDREVPECFNFATDVVDHFALNGDGLALIWTNEAGEEQRYRFSDISQASHRAASALASRGIGKGDVVLIMTPRIPEWQIAWWPVCVSAQYQFPVLRC